MTDSDRRKLAVSAFHGPSLMQRGTLLEIALAVKARPEDTILVFDDATGRVVDLDLRGDAAEIADRLAAPLPAPKGRYRGPEEAKRGRPALGVVSREVTLLPKHWEWLATQKGGASGTLRRLVGEAMKSPEARAEQGRTAAHAFARTMAEVLPGGLPDFDEAMRGLFAGDRDAFGTAARDWPGDVRAHVERLGLSADQV